jgi:hypothetical protein
MSITIGQLNNLDDFARLDLGPSSQSLPETARPAPYRAARRADRAVHERRREAATNFALSMIAGAPGQYAPVADHDVGYLTHDTSAVFDPFANDVAYGQDPSTLLIDLDLEAPGVQGSLSVDGHTIETRAESGLAFTRSPGFVGRVDLPYRAIDAAERESNEAILGIIVSPDPTPLTSFEAGADGWVAQSPMNGGTAVQSSAFATEGAFSLEVTGTTNNWFGRVYDQPLDLSARRAIRYDVQTLGDDTQTAVRVFFGEVRCQSPFGDVPANTTTQVEIDMVNLNCDGLRPADGRATSLYLRFSSGTFRLDNVQLY